MRKGIWLFFLSIGWMFVPSFYGTNRKRRRRKKPRSWAALGADARKQEEDRRRKERDFLNLLT